MTIDAMFLYDGDHFARPQTGQSPELTHDSISTLNIFTHRITVEMC